MIDGSILYFYEGKIHEYDFFNECFSPGVSADYYEYKKIKPLILTEPDPTNIIQSMNQRQQMFVFSEMNQAITNIEKEFHVKQKQTLSLLESFINVIRNNTKAEDYFDRVFPFWNWKDIFKIQCYDYSSFMRFFVRLIIVDKYHIQYTCENVFSVKISLIEKHKIDSLLRCDREEIGSEDEESNSNYKENIDEFVEITNDFYDTLLKLRIFYKLRQSATHSSSALEEAYIRQIFERSGKLFLYQSDGKIITASTENNEAYIFNV